MENSDKRVKKDKSSKSVTKKKQEEEEETKDINITILGGLNVGKSAFVNQYYYRKFLFGYQPTISHSFSKTVEWETETFFLNLEDTSGSDEFKKERERCIKKAEGFIILYDITSLESFQKVSQFLEEIPKVKKIRCDSTHKLDIPITIVGTKLDLVESDSFLRQVSADHLTALSKNTSVAIFELSNKDRTMVVKVVDTLFREILRLEAEKDPTKKMEKKKKKNFLEWFFQRRPSKLDLLEKKILKFSDAEDAEKKPTSSDQTKKRTGFTLSRGWFSPRKKESNTSIANLDEEALTESVLTNVFVPPHPAFSTMNSSPMNSPYMSHSQVIRPPSRSMASVQNQVLPNREADSTVEQNRMESKKRNNSFSQRAYTELDIRKSDEWNSSVRGSRSKTFSGYTPVEGVENGDSPPTTQDKRRTVADLSNHTIPFSSTPPRPKRPYPPHFSAESPLTKPQVEQSAQLVADEKKGNQEEKKVENLEKVRKDEEGAMLRKPLPEVPDRRHRRSASWSSFTVPPEESPKPPPKPSRPPPPKPPKPVNTLTMSSPQPATKRNIPPEHKPPPIPTKNTNVSATAQPNNQQLPMTINRRSASVSQSGYAKILPQPPPRGPSSQAPIHNMPSPKISADPPIPKPNNQTETNDPFLILEQLLYEVSNRKP